MIRIIKGTYGLRLANGVIEPRTSKDEPFSLTLEQEKRLVSRGVAEYVRESREMIPVQQDKLSQYDDLGKMEYNTLKKMAKEMGLPTDGKKPDLIMRIEQAYRKEDEDGMPILEPEEAM